MKDESNKMRSEEWCNCGKLYKIQEEASYDEWGMVMMMSGEMRSGADLDLG